MADIGDWLTQLGLGQYIEAFEAEEVDFEALPHLTESMLVEMGLRIGPRAKLLAAINELQNETSTTEAKPASAARTKVEEPPTATRKSAADKIKMVLENGFGGVSLFAYDTHKHDSAWFNSIHEILNK